MASLAALPRLALAPRYALEGARLSSDAAWRRTRRHGVSQLQALGEARLEGVRFQCNGAVETLPCELLAVHDGVVPNIHLAAALGCDIGWDAALSCFFVRADAKGRTQNDAIWMAGDGAGILGGRAAMLRGRIAARDVAQRLGRPKRALGRRIESIALWQEGQARLAVDRIFPTRFDPLAAPQEAILCRCEEISVGGVHAAIDAGAADLRLLKAFTRLGMGRCQGRMCLGAAATILSEKCGAAVTPPRLRFPVKPVRLSELAALADPDRASTASDA